MLDDLRWPPLSERRQEAGLILLKTIINDLTQVPFEHVLIVKTQLEILDRLIIQLASIDTHFSLKLIVRGTGFVSPKLRHWQNLDLIFLGINVHPFHVIHRIGTAE